ncbi:hypothetical protein Bca52824_024351 [Brassica carinata]|uniref:Uncharacterized protein n=1 Tax=Brassica carinata TaxID=52824 RepID=A0A8X7VJY8_BRACI|nr:hypothetical protein Bca52824_024351 [Brassica carinata]
MESTELYAPEELIKRSPEPSEDDSAENPVSSIQCGRERRLHGSTITDFLAKSGAQGSDVEPRRRLKLMVPNSSCGKHNWKKRATVKQEADFIWKAQIVEGLQQNGWSFVSCTGCSRKLDKSGTSLRCNRCVNPKVTGVIKVSTNEAPFVEDEGGQATASASNTVGAESDEPNPAGFKGKEGRCKRTVSEV